MSEERNSDSMDVDYFAEHYDEIYCQCDEQVALVHVFLPR